MQTTGYEESTSKSLLAGLRMGDPVAWARVSTVYGPLIMYWCQQLGLPRHDRDDICQSVLISVGQYGKNFCKAKPGDGFRKWLFTVTRNEVIKQQTNPHRLPSIDGQSLATLIHAQETDEDDCADPPEVLSELLRRALEVVKNSSRSENWEIFLAAVSEQLSYEEIASRYGTTVGNVRTIRCRYLARLRDVLELTDDSVF